MDHWRLFQAPRGSDNRLEGNDSGAVPVSAASMIDRHGPGHSDPFADEDREVSLEAASSIAESCLNVGIICGGPKNANSPP